MRRQVRLFLVMVVFLSLVVSCASWKSNTVKSYQLTGKALAMIQKNGSSMCQAGVIGADDCGKLKAYYNDARMIYIAMGDVLILAITTEDTVKRKALLDEYDKLAMQYITVSSRLINLAYDLKILKGGN